MEVLVTGLLAFDSGKTTVAEALVREAVSAGIDVGVSKPVTSLSGWYQYGIVRKSMELGLLLGEDMYRLHKAAKSSDPLEKVGPIVSLLLPPDPQRINWNTSYYSGYFAQNQISVLRISSKSRTQHYYVPANIQKAARSLKKEIYNLLKILKPVPASSEEAENLFLTSRGFADECLEELSFKHDLVVVESYSNVAAPTAGALNSELVIVVAPAKIAFFKGKEYRKAIDVVAGLKEPWHITTEDVLQLLRPIKTLDITPGSVGGVLEVVQDLLNQDVI